MFKQYQKTFLILIYFVLTWISIPLKVFSLFIVVNLPITMLSPLIGIYFASKIKNNRIGGILISFHFLAVLFFYSSAYLFDFYIANSLERYNFIVYLSMFIIYIVYIVNILAIDFENKNNKFKNLTLRYKIAIFTSILHFLIIIISYFKNIYLPNNLFYSVGKSIDVILILVSIFNLIYIITVFAYEYKNIDIINDEVKN